MTINHIDQLAEWWETAEVPTSTTLPKDGDRIIIRYNSEWYEIATADGDAGEHELSADTRILARAPKPKPAWHDAKAVIAHTSVRDRRVFVNALDGEWQDADTGAFLLAKTLQDPVPLIEAEVTDEKVLAALRARSIYFCDEPGNRTSDYSPYLIEYTRAMLAAAFGIEAE